MLKNTGGGGYVMDKMRGGMQIWKKPGGCPGGGGGKEEKKGVCDWKKTGGLGLGWKNNPGG